MWDLPGPGIEPVSPALAGGFLTTVPPGKSLSSISYLTIIHWTNKQFFFFFTFFFFNFNFIFGCVGSSLPYMGFSLVVASGGYYTLQCMGFSLWWLLLLQSTGSRHAGFSSCSTWAQQLWLVGFRGQTQWCMGLVALWHVGSSRTRNRTCVPCIGRQILNHCVTREVPNKQFLIQWFMLQKPL